MKKKILSVSIEGQQTSYGITNEAAANEEEVAANEEEKELLIKKEIQQTSYGTTNEAAVAPGIVEQIRVVLPIYTTCLTVLGFDNGLDFSLNRSLVRNFTVENLEFLLSLKNIKTAIDQCTSKEMTDLLRVRLVENNLVKSNSLVKTDKLACKPSLTAGWYKKNETELYRTFDEVAIEYLEKKCSADDSLRFSFSFRH